MLEMILDNILVLPDEPATEKVTASGLIVETHATPKVVNRGTIVAVGDGTYQSGVWIKTHVSVGQRVVFKPFTGFEHEEDDVKYLVLKEPDLIAVIK
jgi:chaperonin GroES